MPLLAFLHTEVKLAARFGFASRDDGTGDIFIPGRVLHGAMPQDKNHHQTVRPPPCVEGAAPRVKWWR